MEELYGVQITSYYEGTFYANQYELFFKSKKHMDDWIKWWKSSDHSSLENITAKGKAVWNTSGILVIKTNRRG